MYVAVDGVKSFPENKYMLAVIKRRTPTPRKPPKQRFKKCRLHCDRDVSLYCRNDSCKALICQLCLLKEHKHHDVIDIKEEEKEKSKALNAKLESAAEKLQMRKEKIFAAKIEAEDKNKRCLRALKETKQKMLKAVRRQMDELMKDATAQISQAYVKFDEDLRAIEEQLTELENLKDSTRSKSITYHDLVDKLEEVHKIDAITDEDLSGHRSYHDTSFKTENIDENIKEICGHLIRNENHIFLQNG